MSDQKSVQEITTEIILEASKWVQLKNKINEVFPDSDIDWEEIADVYIQWRKND